MHKICKCIWFCAHHAGSLRRLRMVMLAGLVVLLMAGCQDEGTPDGSDQAAVDDSGKTSDATGQTRRDGTTVAENDRTSDFREQTLALVTRRLIENADATLSKLADEQEAYAREGNEQGERLMAQAAENVEDIKDAASSHKSHKRYAPAEGSDSAMQAEIDDSIDKLEKNLARAERCCGLPSNFLDSNLRSFRTQAASIEHLVDQMESERPTAQPNAQPTDQYTAPP